MDIETVTQNLYESEINCCIASVWDDGWDVKLGDDLNGFVAEGNVKSLQDAAACLDREARKHFPDSVYAVGEVEHDRREAVRLDAEKNRWQ